MQNILQGKTKLLYWVSIAITLLALLITAANFRLFSYLVGQILSPFSPANNLASGLPLDIKNIESSLDGFSWLSPLLLALVGWLWWRQKTPTASKTQPEIKAIPRYYTILAVIVLFVGGLVRLWPLLGENWLEIRADYDEGVYTMGARLLVDGVAPYRDFFFAHPPGALLGLIPAAVFGGNGAALIWLARFTSVLWCMGSGWLLWLLGRRLGGAWVGLLALTVFMLDGIGVFIGHQVMLEHQLNFFSLLSLFALLKCLDMPATKPDRWLYLSAIATGLAVLTRLNGALLLVTLLVYMLLLRRFRLAIWYTLISGFTVGLVYLFFFLRGGLDIVRQTVFFQLLRQSDGITKDARFDSFAVDARPYSVSGNSKLTILLALLGLAGWALWLWRRKSDGNTRVLPLLSVGLWGSFSLVLLYFNSTFFVHYYVSLLPILALSAGGLTGWWEWLSSYRLWKWVIAGVTALLLIPAALTQLGSLGDYGYSPAPKAFGSFIGENTNPTATVFSFDMFYNLAAKRPLASTPNGKYIIDSYGALKYEAFGLGDKGLGGLISAVFQSERIITNRLYVVGSPLAQQSLLELFGSATMTVLDERGRDYISPATKTALKSSSVELVSNNILGAYLNELTSARAEARQWVAANLPRGAKIWLEPGSIYLSGTFESVVGQDTWRNPLEWYQQQNYSYLILTSEYYGKFYRNAGKYPEQVVGYNRLITPNSVVASFPASKSAGNSKTLGEANQLYIIAVPGGQPLVPLEKQEVSARFGGGLTLQSYNILRQLKPTQSLALSLLWQKATPKDFSLKNVTLYVHILDSAGKLVAQKDVLLGERGFLAEDWPNNRTVLVDGDLALPANLPKGRYRVELGLYYAPEIKGIPVQVGNNPATGALDLGEIVIS